jgi:hypothetical protein
VTADRSAGFAFLSEHFRTHKYPDSAILARVEWSGSRNAIRRRPLPEIASTSFLARQGSRTILAVVLAFL